jgi:hypothetical protein
MTFTCLACTAGNQTAGATTTATGPLPHQHPTIAYLNPAALAIATEVACTDTAPPHMPPGSTTCTVICQQEFGQTGTGVCRNGRVHMSAQDWHDLHACLEPARGAPNVPPATDGWYATQAQGHAYHVRNRQEGHSRANAGPYDGRAAQARPFAPERRHDIAGAQTVCQAIKAATTADADGLPTAETTEAQWIQAGSFSGFTVALATRRLWVLGVRLGALQPQLQPTSPLALSTLRNNLDT